MGDTLRTRMQMVVDVLFTGDATAALASAGEAGPTLEKILAGHTDLPTGALESLASTFGVPVSWLVGEEAYLLHDPAEPVWLALLERFFEARTRDPRLWLRDVRGVHPYAAPQQLIDGLAQTMRSRTAVLRSLAVLLRQRYGTIPDSYCPVFRIEMNAMAEIYRHASTELEAARQRGEVIEKEKPYPDEYYLREWDYEHRVWRG